MNDHRPNIKQFRSLIAAVLTLHLMVFTSAPGQDVSFVASVSQEKVAMGEQFEITFTLQGSGSGNNFRPPAFNDFLTLSGPNQSTNMQYINGSMSTSVTYSYVLQPRSEGKFVIPPAFINYGGKQIQTQPVTIEVTKGEPQSKSQVRQSQPDADIGKQIGDNLFLKVIIDKSRVYQGEQITATYKIYTRVNIVNYAISKVPSLTGFWSEDLDVQKQVQLSNEVVNGKQYKVGILKKVALFPQRSGTLSIDPMEVECVVQVQARRRSGDVFDQFFNDPFFGNVSNAKHKVASQPLSISVTALPPAGVPDGFSGAVGKYTMESWIDKPQTKTNEPVTLKVKISGRGNLKLLTAPNINVSTDIEKYDPKISDNITKQNDVIAGTRTFEYLLIPRHPGEQKIPSFQYAYFDVDRKDYVSFKSPEFSLRVEKGSDNASSYAVGVSKEDVKLLGEDIRFIKSGDPNLRRKGESFFGSLLFFLLAGLPFAGFAGFIMLMKRREKLLGDVLLVRNRRARKIAQRRLTEAKKFLDAKKTEEFHTEISRALWGYIADKLGIPPSDLSIAMVQASLEAKTLPEEIIKKLVSTMETCEYARFAPSSAPGGIEAMYGETVELISSVEERLR